MKTKVERLKFRIADILARSDRTCWAELCSWALGSQPLIECFNGKTCCHDSKEGQHKICYCGKFKDGKRFKGGK